MAKEKKVKDCFGFISGSLLSGRNCGKCASVDRCIEGTCLNKMVSLCSRAALLVKWDEERFEGEYAAGKKSGAT